MTAELSFPSSPIMFNTSRIIWFTPSIVLLLVVTLSAFTGCRWLSSRTPASPMPVAPSANVPTPQPSTDMPDRYSAFRPIIAEPFAQAAPVPSRTVPEPSLPKREVVSELSQTASHPDAAVQLKMDELLKRVAELESQLAAAQQSPPILEDPLPKNESENADSKKSETIKLPIINKPGVTVSADALQRVRIEVIDKVLFMPNEWQLTTEGEEILRTIAAEVRAFDSEAVLDIEGHTDSLMSDPSNPTQKHDISSVKAHAVMGFFVNTLRWDAARIGSSSFGRSRPVADNGTPEGRERNNRIEVVLRTSTKQ